ncbi:PadR family transcriptional regulator [Tengunoibacter tsumagoiensis]|uniref:PadR family transcriptional regulator n=1 Tax=Tengunoibacter tsumagoiensis TaxID=2014871 RepID=A0A402A5Y6_9CHLR|nr:PadR family transcriptional regulator [Tengunoibacter tsumagoiensis]GCE14532.1 PadR family transcriptional regulator [Tengunoibacter tsumagoiensis]
MEQEAYPITYGVLGLLAFWGPLSGYDLKRIFDHTLAPMWGAAQSQIYKELRRMKELGWVEMEREEQEARPDRKVYSITEQGHVALRQWQAQSPEIFQLRDELLLKVLFGTFAAPGDIAQHLHASIATHERSLLAYRQNAHHIPAQGTYPQGNRRPNPYVAERESDPYFALITQFAIDFENTYIRWLYQALEIIEQNQSVMPSDTSQ